MEITIKCPVCNQQQDGKLITGSYYIQTATTSTKCIRCKVKLKVCFSVEVDTGIKASK